MPLLEVADLSVRFAAQEGRDVEAEEGTAPTAGEALVARARALRSAAGVPARPSETGGRTGSCSSPPITTMSPSSISAPTPPRTVMMPDAFIALSRDLLALRAQR